MDKILLTAFLSALAGFITAVLSIVKLVNEKESKTTEYRQAWTDSVRKAFADLVAKINAQAGRISAAASDLNALNRLHSDNPNDEETPTEKRLRDHLEKTVAEHRQAIHENRMGIYECYSLSRLHFKPNDLSFNRIEQKFDVIDGMLSQLGKLESDADRAEFRQKIHSGANEIAGYARDILKTEWETVKRGEPTYQETKKWSIRGSIIMLAILLAIGAYAGISIWKENIRSEKIHLSPKVMPSQQDVK